MHKVNKGFYVGVFLAGRLGQVIIWEITQFLRMVSFFQKKPKNDFSFAQSTCFSHFFDKTSIFEQFMRVFSEKIIILNTGEATP